MGVTKTGPCPGWVIRTYPKVPVRGKGSLSWGDIIDNLLRIRMFNNNWDNKGSPAPPPEVTDAAILMAMDLKTEGCQPPDLTTPSVRGTVLFLWVASKGVHEIEVQSPFLAAQYWNRTGLGKTHIVHFSRKPFQRRRNRS